MRTHYPRTPHLPWSPGASADDIRAGGVGGLSGRQVVVTEKLDGENTTLYRDGLHARSLDSGHHPSRAWVKALHGRIAGRIPAGWRVCGENLAARHSLPYDRLDGWFYAFSVWAGSACLGWDETVRVARRLGVPTPPVLWRGVFDERALRRLRLDLTRQEGYVVRTVAGFDADEFDRRVAKWVRRGHVTTDRHWMLAPVVPNGLGPAAALWDVASGAAPDAPTLAAALDTAPPAPATVAAVAEVADRLDLIGRVGDARLGGVVATLRHDAYRSEAAAGLVAPLGMPLARRTADLVGLHPRLRRGFPDEQRRAGLVGLAQAADLGVLHAVAASAPARPDEEADARDQVDWSALHAEEAGLLGETPWADLRAGLVAALDGVPDDAADRCWAAARAACGTGRILSSAEALPRVDRWRSGGFPRLTVMVGPAASGKSTAVAGLPGVDTVIGLDELRGDRGARGDQRANPAVLRDGLARLDAALAAGGGVVWDATGLNRHQRGLVHAVARRHAALVTHAVLLVPGDELRRRNAAREHRVPDGVLAAQLRRFAPPYPGEAHRIRYLDAAGAVADVAGALRTGEA